MDENSGFDCVKEERKNLAFFKIFQRADLSSESMRGFPYNLITRIPKKDLSDKMVIRAQWGTSWDVKISKNMRFYYMEKSGWDQFVSDNGLGDKEFATFIHKGKMIFDVHIYENNGWEMLTPRNPLLLGSLSQVKKEQRESSFKDVKKEGETSQSPGRVELQVRKMKTEKSDSSNKKNSMKEQGESSFKDVKKEGETGQSPGRVELQVRKMKTEKSESSNKKNSMKEQGESCFKDVKKEDETGETPGRVEVQGSDDLASNKKVEMGESSRGAELKVRKRKDEDTRVSKKKKINSNQKKYSSAPEFKVTIRKSHLRCLVIPKEFVGAHIPIMSEYFKIHHVNGTKSWKVGCLVSMGRTILSCRYPKLARGYPLSVGDVCTFKLIKPFEFLLLVSRKVTQEIVIS